MSYFYNGYKATVTDVPRMLLILQKVAGCQDMNKWHDGKWCPLGRWRWAKDKNQRIMAVLQSMVSTKHAPPHGPIAINCSRFSQKKNRPATQLPKRVDSVRNPTAIFLKISTLLWSADRPQPSMDRYCSCGTQWSVHYLNIKHWAFRTATSS